jgi:hypothetical protein
VAVQAAYRADQISNREIARRYSVTEAAIRLRAKTEGWAKDLGHKVAIGVKDAVLRSSFAKSATQIRKGKEREATEHAVVQAAIQDGKEVVLRHQDLGKRIATNSGRLQAIVERQLEILERDPENPIDEKAFSFLTKAHDHIASASLKAVAIERQARGLDEMPADPNAPPSISITYYRSDLVLNNNQPAGTAPRPAIDVKALPK